jgi:hypothetical protein
MPAAAAALIDKPPAFVEAPRAETRARFRLLVEADSGQAGIHQLRHALKSLARQFGVRCVDAIEIEPEDEPLVGRLGAPAQRRHLAILPASASTSGSDHPPHSLGGNSLALRIKKPTCGERVSGRHRNDLQAVGH